MGLTVRSSLSRVDPDGIEPLRPARSRRRAVRRRLRSLWTRSVRVRARLDADTPAIRATGRPSVVDHGYLVPTVHTDQIDHHRHAVVLYGKIESALGQAGARCHAAPSSWREPASIDVVGDRDRVWRALADLDSERFALTVQAAAPTERTTGHGMLAAALGVEFTAFSARPAGWGPPLPLDGPAPAARDWLVADHETVRDGSRHLGLDAAIRLRFVDALPTDVLPTDDRPTRTGPDGRRSIGFPIDAVFTWVDFQDPRWQQQFADTARPDNLVRAAANESRFNHVNELRYSMRSISEFAPWINHIWLVTAGQVPSWLDVTDPRISIVDHDQIWAGSDGLPTFNSQAIEANLHRIPGLAEHFLYFNDDMLIGRPVQPDTFFTADGKPKAFVSSAAVPEGDPSSRDLAPDAAGKNNRRLVAEATGEVRSSKYQHAPYALRRSIIAQLEQKFAAELAATRRAQFRSTSDVTAAGGLHHSYALATGQAVPGDIRYRYVDLESPHADHLLDGIRRYRYYESFCVNVVVRGPRDPAGLVRFLQSYYPNPAPWEKCVGQS